MDQIVALLARWANFYVMVGSAAASLTGLQFVVIALADGRQQDTTGAGIDAFSTPTVVYFSTALLLSAVLTAPWNGASAPALLLAVCGAAGLGYALLVARRAQRLAAYRLVLEDWVWHIAFPLTANVMLLAAGLALVRHPTKALFTIAAAALFLLFIGIHNAWDIVTYLVIQRLKGLADKKDRPEPPPA